ncbi:MAG TPA: RibD family protein [Candidatus Mediterraneibacter intestinavium]|nr:RibD family protein [Candidatus Mediterraneibacter intestinavium]
MKRPYVICHILSSLDGKINGPFMGTETAGRLAGEYGAMRSEMDADAWMYGTTTTQEFTDFRKPERAELESAEENSPVPDGDFVADDHADLYYVSVDTEGVIGWESGEFWNRGRAPAHVIELLTEGTPSSYKAYLRKRGVSYIVAGKEMLDCREAMEKLYRLFHIEKLLLCGGGGADWSFLDAGMVDELSLVIAPVTDGSQGSASVFAGIPGLNGVSPLEFSLKEVRQTEGGGVYLRCLAKNAK